MYRRPKKIGMREFNTKRNQVAKDAENGITTIITRFGKEIWRAVPPPIEYFPNETMEKEFEKLWSMYPRREQRKRALDVYKTLNPQLREVLPLAVKAHMDQPRGTFLNKEYKYLPLLETWLSEERWKEEMPTVTTKSSRDPVKDIKKLRAGGWSDEQIAEYYDPDVIKGVPR